MENISFFYTFSSRNLFNSVRSCKYIVVCVFEVSLATEGLFSVKWSDIIQDEWLQNLLKKRADLNKEQLMQTIQAREKNCESSKFLMLISFSKQTTAYVERIMARSIGI